MAEEGNIVELLKRALAGEEPSERTDSVVVVARKQILKDPSKAAGLAYLWLTAVGFTRIFGDGMSFGVNTVDLASPSDFLLAGLRDPMVGIAAAITGAGLFWMSGKGVTSRGWRIALGPTAVALLALGIYGSAAYRHAVVAGAWQNAGFAPLPSVVTLDHDHDGTLDTIPDLRLVLATADYFVFHRDPNETVILKKDSVKRIELHLVKEQIMKRYTKP